jgi:hypothetical protein
VFFAHPPLGTQLPRGNCYCLPRSEIGVPRRGIGYDFACIGHHLIPDAKGSARNRAGPEVLYTSSRGCHKTTIQPPLYPFLSSLWLVMEASPPKIARKYLICASTTSTCSLDATESISRIAKSPTLVVTALIPVSIPTSHTVAFVSCGVRQQCIMSIQKHTSFLFLLQHHRDLRVVDGLCHSPVRQEQSRWVQYVYWPRTILSVPNSMNARCRTTPCHVTTD